MHFGFSNWGLKCIFSKVWPFKSAFNLDHPVLQIICIFCYMHPYDCLYSSLLYSEGSLEIRIAFLYDK